MIRARAGYALFSSHGTSQIHQGCYWEVQRQALVVSGVIIL